ncbi:MAG: FGGY family carbohydrate kinase [Candidatus Caldarchaeum sp.]|nr:FGGY family carbohydrate kinase [Candidatus Caldarchaeum sp.]
MFSHYLIGVDIGTAGTKAAVFDVEGNQLAVSYEESKLYYPRVGWVEQNPDDFVISTVNTVRGVVEKSGINPREVAAIAFSGQMAGILAVDRNWEPVIPYDSWLDIRCKTYLDQLKASHEELLIRKTGAPPTIDHLPKMIWWKKERPEVFERICKFTVPAVYVAGKLAGLKGEQAFYDYTYVTFTGLFDVHRMSWSEELAEVFGLPLDKMPDVVKPWDVVGELVPEMAEKLGLVRGIPVIAGAGDGMACAFGAGLTQPGTCLDIAGTASAFYVSVDKIVPDLRHRTLLYLKSVVPDLWCVGAYINGGGLCLRWFRDEIAKQEKAMALEQGRDPYEILDEKAAEIPAGSEGIFFIPHLGGRAYPYNPKIRGLWLGFTWRHTTAHLYRSILESIAYEYNHYLTILRQLLQNVAINEVRGIGGGSRSKIWNQIKADVLGTSYVLLNREEYAVTALAVIAGHGVKAFPDMVKTMNEWVRPTKQIEPRRREHEIYREHAAFYEKTINQIDRLLEGHEQLT